MSLDSGRLRVRSSAYANLLADKRSYSWSDWRDDQEESMWHLFYAITRTVRENDLPMLDQLEFSDFVNFCQRHTHAPARGKRQEEEEEALAGRSDSSSETGG